MQYGNFHFNTDFYLSISHFNNFFSYSHDTQEINTFHELDSETSSFARSKETNE